MEGSKRSIAVLAAIFTGASITMSFIYSNLPNLPEEQKSAIKLPSDIEDAKVLLLQ